MTRLEHANISVRDLDAAIAFLAVALPEFSIRGGSAAEHPGWVHFGTDETYLSLTHTPNAEVGKFHRYADLGVNHIGIVVDDVDAVVARLRDAGYRQSTVMEVTPWRKRYYFFDADDQEWEFIEYLTDDPARKNEYL